MNLELLVLKLFFLKNCIVCVDLYLSPQLKIDCTNMIVVNILMEKEMSIDSSILAWQIPWTEESVGCSPWNHNRQTRLTIKPPEANILKKYKNVVRRLCL